MLTAGASENPRRRRHTRKSWEEPEVPVSSLSNVLFRRGEASESSLGSSKAAWGGRSGVALAPNRRLRSRLSAGAL